MNFKKIFFVSTAILGLMFFSVSCGGNAGDSSAVDFASKLGAGWNLGNTFDAWNNNNSDLSSETCWGMPLTTKNMIHDIREKGFKTIRIPVSWHTHITETENYTIDSQWMNRVKQIVDWAIEEDFYVIINIHHDNACAVKGKSGTYCIDDAPGFAVSSNVEIQKKSKKYISKVWKQIAETFAGYDERLIFEILNEPRDSGSVEWSEWWLSNAAEPCRIITSYEQSGLDAIRAVPGNEERYVLVPGYAGSADWTMLQYYEMPVDTAEGKLLLETHGYTPNNFALGNASVTKFTNDDKGNISWMFNQLKQNFVDKGTGVVMDEASCSNKNNLSDRTNWFKHYMQQAKNSGIPVVLWDNMVTVNASDPGECHGYYNRRAVKDSEKWFFPDLVDIMIKALN